MTPPRILIVDDDPAQRLLVSNVLSQAEFDVSAAEDGATGLSVMQVEQPDLVLLDVVMPGMSGFEVCETIRGSAEIAHIPIVIVTACVAVAALPAVLASTTR